MIQASTLIHKNRKPYLEQLNIPIKTRQYEGKTCVPGTLHWAILT